MKMRKYFLALVATVFLTITALGQSGVIYNVKDYAAPGVSVGTYGVNATDAVNAALSDMGSNGGILFFPVGHYLITSTITLSKPVIVRGAGQASIIYGSGFTLFKVTFAAGATFEDLSIKEELAGSLNTIGILFDNGADGVNSFLIKN